MKEKSQNFSFPHVLLFQIIALEYNDFCDRHTHLLLYMNHRNGVHPEYPPDHHQKIQATVSVQVYLKMARNRHRNQVHFHFSKILVQFEFERVSSQRPAVVQRSSLLLPFRYKLKVMDQNLKPFSGEKPNKCNQCDSAFSRAGHLRTHLKTHSGEKSNKCNQCNFASSQAGDLRTHL